MINNDHQISRVTDVRFTQKTLRELYGFVIDVNPDEDEQLYLVAVIRDNTIGPPDMEPAIMPLVGITEDLAMRVGPPENLKGRRVRIIYSGHNWKTGVAELAPDRDVSSVNQALDIPSRGFRYAIAGGGS